MNFVIILTVAIIGGSMELLTQQQFPSGSAIRADTAAPTGYFIHAHGRMLAFWVFVPLFPTTLGMYFFPPMIGARGFTFPRLNTLSLYLFAISAIIGVLTIEVGNIDPGWALAPLSNSAGNVDFAFIVALLIGIFAMIMINLNIVVTALMSRASGVGWSDLPVFAWGLIAASIVGALTLPLGFLALLFLLIDRQWQTGLFDTALGGNPGIYRHALWFAAHPALYNTILPTVGIIAAVLGLTPHRTPVMHRRLVLCIVAIAALNSITWGVELMTSISPRAAAVFSSLAMLILIPALIIAGDLLRALKNNGIRLTPPIFYALSFLFFAGNGVASGLMLRPLSTGMQLFNTTFNTAHLHILLIGGVGSAFLAGILYWWPRIVGRGYSVSWTAVAAMLFFEGVNIAFFPKFVIGLKGVPTHIADTTPMYAHLQQISASGACLLSLGVVIQLVVLAHSGLLNPRSSGQ